MEGLKDVCVLEVHQQLRHAYPMDCVPSEAEIVIATILHPRNVFSYPLPGTDDEYLFGLFGKVTVLSYLTHPTTRAIIKAGTLLETQLSYYDYNDRGRVVTRLDDSHIYGLLRAQLRKVYNRMRQDERLRPFTTENPPPFSVQDLLSPLIPAVEEWTRTYSRYLDPTGSG